MNKVIRKRNNNIHFMVSDDEKAKIEELFKNLGYKSKQEFYLSMILDRAVINFDHKNELSLELKKISTLISNVTNNINQCAKVANSTGEFTQEDFKDLREFQIKMGEYFIEFRLLVEEKISNFIKKRIIKNGSYQNTSN